MGLLQNSTKGVVEQPPIILIYGEGGLGKTTFLSEAPKPYVIDVEGGSHRVKIDRSPKPSAYDEVVGWIDELTNDAHEYKTIGIDTLDALEVLMWKKICKDHGNAKSMVLAAGGYGNAYKIEVELWAEFQKKLLDLRAKKNTQIILLAHQIVSTYNDPTTTGGYDRFSIKLHESQKVSSARLWFDFVDAVLFAKREVLETKEKKRVVEADENEHSIFTQGRAAFDAKNRFSLPFKIPLRYAAFEAAMKKGPRTAKEIKASIESLIAEVQKMSETEELVEKMKAGVKEAGSDVIYLQAIEERILEILKG